MFLEININDIYEFPENNDSIEIEFRSSKNGMGSSIN